MQVKPKSYLYHTQPAAKRYIHSVERVLNKYNTHKKNLRLLTGSARNAYLQAYAHEIRKHKLFLGTALEGGGILGKDVSTYRARYIKTGDEVSGLRWMRWLGLKKLLENAWQHGAPQRHCRMLHMVVNGLLAVRAPPPA